ncbi:MAG: DUF3710 domain-containing protein [Propionibacteriaceae bacterium]|nr:DUF3710 domain-containing protein [Propionibacteriaceae bacterium]
MESRHGNLHNEENKDGVDVIFGRKKSEADTEDLVDSAQEVTDLDQEEVDEDFEDDEFEDLEDDEFEEEVDEWTRLDLSQDWRVDGPFDIDEVDLGGDEVKRLDLGVLVVTPEAGMKLTLIAEQGTKEIKHLLVSNCDDSALQLTVYAAPGVPGYCSVIREELAKGVKAVQTAPGPFGTELRRVLAITDPQGKQGYAPVRDWLIAGPRWVLNARLTGKAALDADSPTGAELKEFVHNTVVRRGDTAMAPGAIIPLTPVIEGLHPSV